MDNLQNNLSDKTSSQRPAMKRSVTGSVQSTVQGRDSKIIILKGLLKRVSVYKHISPHYIYLLASNRHTSHLLEVSQIHRDRKKDAKNLGLHYQNISGKGSLLTIGSLWIILGIWNTRLLHRLSSP